MENRANIPNVLIVDDEIGPRESLRMILKQNYNVFAADNGASAIEMVRRTKMDVVTLDLKMAGISGIDALKEIRSIDSDVMAIIITGFGSLKTAIEAIRYGVFDYIAKPFNVPEILSIINRSVKQRRVNLKVKEFLAKYGRDLFDGAMLDVRFSLRNDEKEFFNLLPDETSLSDSQHYLEFAKVLSSTLEEKDSYTFGHSERVCYYSDFISNRLSLHPREKMEIQIASYLHDIGKIGISDRFINKREALNFTDWAIIKQHTKKSIEILSPLRLSAYILSCIQHHHEHFDGTGYPDGLIGEQIPLGARILAIADSYDSMTSDRPYRKPLPNEEAKEELMKCSGKQFDPHIVSTFLDILNEIEQVLLKNNRVNTSFIQYPMTRIQ